MGHLTDHRSVAAFDLSELGPPGPKAWLNPDLLFAVDTDFLAIHYRRFLCVIDWCSGSAVWFNIFDHLSRKEEEHVSALEWLVFDDIRVIVIGTSCGYLLILSPQGNVIHRQLVYPGRILSVRLRRTKKCFKEDTSLSKEMCVVIPGIIARFDVSDIQKVVQRLHQEAKNRFGYESSINGGSEDTIIPYHLWNVSKYGSFVDAALTSVSPVVGLLRSNDRYYGAVTIGADASISAFRLSKDQSRSFVEAILSMAVPAAVSTICSFSKIIWTTRQPTKKAEPKLPPFGQVLPLACLKDHLSTGDKLFLSLGVTSAFFFTHLIANPIKGGKLTLSPSGTLAAVTDSRGRIMLLDTRTLVVVHLWNGYQDADCLFVERLVNKDSPGHVKSDYCLCLAIHAPRKGIVEIWKMRTGPRILMVPCPKGSRIMQPPYRFGSAFSASSSTRYEPLQVFLLNGDSGQLSRLN